MQEEADEQQMVDDGSPRQTSVLPHARENDRNLVGWHSITLHKAELFPLRPRNEPARGPEAVAVQAPFPSLSPAHSLAIGSDPSRCGLPARNPMIRAQFLDSVQGKTE